MNTSTDSLTFTRAIKRQLPEFKGTRAEAITPIVPEILTAARVIIRARLKHPAPRPVVLMAGGIEKEALNDTP